MPDAVIYMNRNLNVLESWKRFKRFSDAMLDLMTSVLDELEEPSSIVKALNSLPNRRRSSANHDDGWLDLRGPAQRLATCAHVCEMISDKKAEQTEVEGGLKYSLFVFCLISKFI